MNVLQNKRIVLGITGGIAAYKSAELVRLLTKRGCQVRVMMTEAATEFVTPLTFQALSGNPVQTDLLDPAAEAAMGHIELARWADAIVIAPCSANTLAALARGEAHDLLTTCCLASTAPLVIAPAMNRVMWENNATQENVSALKHRGALILGPDSGAQACGETGVGRMLEAADIVPQLENLFASDLLSGLHVLITAGPTRERIDPVRFISNYSSGKMGFALAAAAQEAGAAVTLVTGPVNLATPQGVVRIDVESADEMLQAVQQQPITADIFIATAAVADYKMAAPATQKIKKTSDSLTLSFERNPDILAHVAAENTATFTVGFAAETEKLEQHAQEKLHRKKIDLILANPVDPQKNIGFNSDENSLTAFWNDGERPSTQAFHKNTKIKLARNLMPFIRARFSEKQTSNTSRSKHYEKTD